MHQQLYFQKFSCLYKLNVKREQMTDYHKSYYIWKKENDEAFAEKIRQRNRLAYYRRKGLEVDSVGKLIKNKIDKTKIINTKIRLFWN